ncbi:Scavenger mRNA decapping enzyme C-term binding [seawater metagenome]|uniref:Scavenger mRNA decapping enzyme C-term binding n=1 Tax=seawater metagenome TaxID=1561972 RepID=A0A5E8CHC7_9ZZZZ
MFIPNKFIIQEDLSISRKKQIKIFLGFLKDNPDEKIILILSSKEDENYNTVFCNSTVNNLIENDKYYNFTLISSNKAEFLVNMIKPASEKDIQKYRSFNKINFIETPDYYLNKVLPYIEKYECIPDKLDWINNILEGKKENEKIILSNDDFVLLPDIVWDCININELYYLAISKDKSIKSLRDISGKHIPILQKIQKEGIAVIKDKHGIPQDRIITFVHYYPSFYHFHIHFVYLENDIYESGTGRNHYLSTIINNLKLDSEYYKKMDLEMIIPESHSNINL